MTIQRIERHLRSFLWRYQRLHIPGIGLFVLHHKEADIRLQEGRIYPPSSKLTFEETTLKSKELATYIAMLEGMGTYETQDYLVKYVKDLKKSIDKNGSARVGDLGSLTLDGEGKLVFKEDQSLSFSMYQNLDSYPISPIKRIVQQEDFNTEVIDREEESTLKYWLPFIIISLITLAGLFWWYNQERDIPTITEEEQLDQVIEEEKEQGDYELYQEINDVKDTSIEEVISDEMVSDTSDMQEVSSDGESTDAYECVMIVGSYKSAKSTLKMMNKLEDLGYKVYTENYEDYTRVGIAFICKEKDLTLFIREVRKTLAPDAWYLIPRITVH